MAGAVQVRRTLLPLATVAERVGAPGASSGVAVAELE